MLYSHGSLLLTWFNFIPTWICNHTPSKVWDENTDPFQNFNGSTVEVWEGISSFIPYFKTGVIIYPYMKGCKYTWICLRSPPRCFYVHFIVLVLLLRFCFLQWTVSLCGSSYQPGLDIHRHGCIVCLLLRMHCKYWLHVSAFKPPTW